MAGVNGAGPHPQDLLRGGVDQENLRARIESVVRRPRKVDLSLLDPRR